MFENFPVLLLGLVSGLVFGFLLHRGRVTKYEVIVNQFRLRDFTVLKTMLTAVLVGGWGVYVLQAQGGAPLLVKPAFLLANIAGGVVFGVGMVLLGLCPGTALAALGEGNRRALAGVLGMLVGAFLQAETYSPLAALWRAVDWGTLTWPALFSVSPGVLLAGLTLAALALFLTLERWERRSQSAPVSAPPEKEQRAVA
jgi:uncharacterized membrane protein YedE/YeeE